MTRPFVKKPRGVPMHLTRSLRNSRTDALNSVRTRESVKLTRTPIPIRLDKQQVAVLICCLWDSCPAQWSNYQRRKSVWRALMQLTSQEEAMRRGEMGEAAQWGLEYQIAVGEFFGARRLVPILSAHVMCDAEAAREPGVQVLEKWAERDGKVRVPTTIDPRSTDFAKAQALGQETYIVELEQRILASMRQLGALPCNTCINYQVIEPPTFGARLGWGDTGTVIFANSVAGARSNYEGGPAGLAAALCGRVAEYGFHLDEYRRGTVEVEMAFTPQNSSEWGAVGCIVGRAHASYWTVPVFTGISATPSTDELKQLGAALASYGSQAMFHMVGVTPEARTRDEAFAGRAPQARMVVTRADLEAVYRGFQPEKEEPDLIVFGTPQLSMFEVKELTEAFADREVAVPVFMTTSPQVKASADELGYTELLEEAGVTFLSGVCFYLMAARELSRRHNFRTILTNSSKLANIIEGYGYNPVFRDTRRCVEAALSGRIAKA